MLIVETLQVVFTAAVVVLATEKQRANPLILWTATGFGTSQIITAIGGVLPDSFFRLLAAALATILIDKWRIERNITTWAAGPAALVSGLLVGWAT